MTTIVLSNADATLNAQYKTDLIGVEGNFTILAKTKDDDLETQLGIGFTDTMYNLDHFKAIAEDNELKLELVSSDGVTEVVALPDPEPEPEV